MSERDWDAEAATMASYVTENLPDRRRGVIEGRQSRVSVVFGRDPGRDPAEVLDEVARIRDALDRQGIRVLGFAAPEDGATWALLVESEEIPLLEEIVADPDS
jgi:hypothetical protein